MAQSSQQSPDNQSSAKSPTQVASDEFQLVKKMISDGGIQSRGQSELEKLVFGSATWATPRAILRKMVERACAPGFDMSKRYGDEYGLIVANQLPITPLFSTEEKQQDEGKSMVVGSSLATRWDAEGAQLLGLTLDGDNYMEASSETVCKLYEGLPSLAVVEFLVSSQRKEKLMEQVNKAQTTVLDVIRCASRMYVMEVFNQEYGRKGSLLDYLNDLNEILVAQWPSRRTATEFLLTFIHHVHKKIAQDPTDIGELLTLLQAGLKPCNESSHDAVRALAHKDLEVARQIKKDYLRAKVENRLFGESRDTRMYIPDEDMMNRRPYEEFLPGETTMRYGMHLRRKMMPKEEAEVKSPGSFLDSLAGPGNLIIQQCGGRKRRGSEPSVSVVRKIHELRLSVERGEIDARHPEMKKLIREMHKKQEEEEDRHWWYDTKREQKRRHRRSGSTTNVVVGNRVAAQYHSAAAGYRLDVGPISTRSSTLGRRGKDRQERRSWSRSRRSDSRETQRSVGESSDWDGSSDGRY